MKTQEERAWVRQPSGRRLDLIHPDPNGWDDEDLAVGLSRTYRWAGHSVWSRPMSVAQHSLLVMHLRASQTPGEELSRADRLRELLHDAEEGLIGFDAISPLKPVLGPMFAALMDRLTQAVWMRYGLERWTVDGKRRHKLADNLAAASEAVHVAGWARQEVREVLQIQQVPLHVDPLQAIYGGQAWEPWSAEVSASRFLEALQALQDHRLAA